MPSPQLKQSSRLCSKSGAKQQTRLLGGQQEGPSFLAGAPVCHFLHVFSRNQYVDLKAYVSPIVNWNEFRLVGGCVSGGAWTGGSFR